MPRAGGEVDRRDREAGQRDERDSSAQNLHDAARSLASEHQPDAVGDRNADRLPGNLGEQAERHAAMILDAVGGSDGDDQCTLLQESPGGASAFSWAFAIASACGSYGPGWGTLTRMTGVTPGPMIVPRYALPMLGTVRPNL